MHVLFIEPPPTLNWGGCESDLTTAGRRHPSLNVTGEKVYSYLNLSAAAVLRKRGHSVSYIHCQTEDVTIDDLRKKIPEINPDMVVLMVEHINLSVHNVISTFTKQETDAVVVFVGPLVTALDEELINLHCDYIVRKEWDYTLSNLADAIENNKPLSQVLGITYKEDGKCKRNSDAPLIENLDDLPFPAYDLVDHRKFNEAVFKRFPTATVITSRGCPYQCIFCVFPNTIYSHKFRSQSAKRVIEEARFLNKEFGIKAIRYDDDTFEINTQRVIDICKEFEKARLDLIWACQSRAALITLDLAKRMKNAGCTLVLYGVESGDDEILKMIRKGTTTKEIRQGVANAKRAGLDVLNCIMLGFYWDTKETIRKTIKFAFELNAEFTQFSIATPLPGTDYCKLLKEKDCFLSDKWEDSDSFHHANLALPYLSGEEVTNSLKDVYRKYYTRPEYLWMMGKRMFRSKDDFFQTMRGVNALCQRIKKGWA